IETKPESPELTRADAAEEQQISPHAEASGSFTNSAPCPHRALKALRDCDKARSVCWSSAPCTSDLLSTRDGLQEQLLHRTDLSRLLHKNLLLLSECSFGLSESSAGQSVSFSPTASNTAPVRSKQNIPPKIRMMRIEFKAAVKEVPELISMIKQRRVEMCVMCYLELLQELVSLLQETAELWKHLWWLKPRAFSQLMKSSEGERREQSTELTDTDAGDDDEGEKYPHDEDSLRTRRCAFDEGNLGRGETLMGNPGETHVMSLKTVKEHRSRRTLTHTNTNHRRESERETQVPSKYQSLTVSYSPVQKSEKIPHLSVRMLKSQSLLQDSARDYWSGYWGLSSGGMEVLTTRLPLLFLLLVTGVFGLYDVSYGSSEICAVKGSTVIMSCSYNYPDGGTVTRAFWTNTDLKEEGEEFPDLSEDPQFSERVQYLGDEQNKCDLRLRDVREEDAGLYNFRFITDAVGGHWIGTPGVSLSVTDLQVEAPGRVKEGDRVVLSCKSSCDLTEREFIWFRNSKRVTKGIQRDQLLLKSIRREDSGRYKCAQDGELRVSPEVLIDVFYPPSNVSVSVSGSGEVKEGDSVTLSCRADSNPPAKLSWFKRQSYSGSGTFLTVPNISLDDEEAYKCKALNKQGIQYSVPVRINVIYPPRNISVSISGASGADSVTLSCRADSNPPALNFSWFQENGSSAVGSGQSFTALQSGSFYCEAHHPLGSQRSAAVSVSVMSSRTAAPLLFLLMIPWISGQTNLHVRYNHSSICALRSSTVTLMCYYSRSIWIVKGWRRTKPFLNPNQFSDRRYRQGYCYSEYEQCYYLTINQVTEKDSDQYVCAVTHFGRPLPAQPLSLTVTDLQVEAPGEVKEGDQVVLSCKSSCDLTERASFLWFRNSERVTEGIYGQNLILDQVRREDSGGYDCRVDSYSSSVSYLDVQYPPESIVLSVSGSGEIKEGDSVTLNCSSDANPPAQITWFKRAHFLSFGATYTIIRVSPGDRGDYKCEAENIHGIKYSNFVTLNIMYPPKNVSVSISGSAQIEVGDSVSLRCNSDSNPPADRFNWFQDGRFSGTGRTLKILKAQSHNGGKYKCSVSNKHGRRFSDAVTLNVLYPPVKPEITISSGQLKEGDLVTLNCHTDANPPADIYWFKEKKFLGCENVISLKISADDDGKYRCRAVNDIGEQFSEFVTLNVMYPPKSVSVLVGGSIKTSGADSVTLSCSADSNPPVLNFSWFQENGSSAVGSGQSFTALQSGSFYCEAHHPLGSQRSAAVSVSGGGLEESSSDHSINNNALPFSVRKADGKSLLFLIAMVSAGLLVIFIVTITIVTMKVLNRRAAVHEYENENPGAHVYTALDLRTRSSELYDTLITVHLRPSLHQSLSPEYENTPYLGSVFDSWIRFSGGMVARLRLLLLLMIHRVYGSSVYRVSYGSPEVCAVEGSTVTMSCSFVYPSGSSIVRVNWSKKDHSAPYREFPDLSEDPQFSERVQYLGDKQQKCDLRLRDVRQEDAGLYYFRIDIIQVKWADVTVNVPAGVSLSVTDLQVEAPGGVKEGDRVVLSCKSSCDLTKRAPFIWFRNSERVTEGIQRNQLLLRSIRREDSGRYQCALDGELCISPEVHMKVLYPPSRVSVSVSPSGKIFEGDTVTLTCSTDSNPPAKLSWFKEGSFLQSGATYSFNNATSQSSGRFHCSARNKHGSQDSSAVDINVLSGQHVEVDVHLITEASAIIFICFVIILILFLIKRKYQKPVYENPTANTYTVLDPRSRSSDVYHSLMVHSTPAGSSVYENLSPLSARSLLAAVVFAMETSVRVGFLLSLMFLLMIHGSRTLYFTVKYETSYICAHEGSTVTIRCSYSFPLTYKVDKTFWTKSLVEDKNGDYLDLSEDPEYQQRIQYFGDNRSRCGLILNHVKKEDELEYYFSLFVKNGQNHEPFLGSPGVTLSVTDLQVEAPGRVKEGDRVVLSCKSSCYLMEKVFIWFKNSQRVIEGISGNKLILKPARREDSGRYQCALDGELGSSPEAMIDVLYAPKRISASIIGPLVITEGASVTLSCSSDSNPQAELSWFGGGNLLDSGRLFRISKISSMDSGKYRCRARNELGEAYSDPLIINVMYPPKNVLVSVSGSGEILEGDPVTLSCSADSNPPTLKFSWFKAKMLIASGNIYRFKKISFNDSGEYRCKAYNDHGVKYSHPVNLNVWYAPRHVSASVSGSGSVWLADSVTLSCRADSNPPALNFSWFQENRSSAVGSGQSFTALQSGSFYCEAHNPLGSQRSAAVLVDVKDQHWKIYHTTIVVSLCGLVAAVLIALVTCYFRKKRKPQVEPPTNPPVNISTTFGPSDTASELYLNADDVCPGPRNYSLSDYENFPDHDTPTYHRASKRLLVESRAKVKEQQCEDVLAEHTWPEYWKKCDLSLRDVRLEDAGVYYFRFITNAVDGKWTGTPGVSLSVTDLQVEAPGKVKEGDWVVLSCKSSCSLTEKAPFIWFRNSERVTKGIQRNKLHLRSIRREDSGRYQCAQAGASRSPEVLIDVLYEPRNVSVSISPSGEITEGDR
ncbi:hypothetical protein DNTS_031456, partial [Danionella cerebrum]